jgi:hypothetical protein
MLKRMLTSILLGMFSLSVLAQSFPLKGACFPGSTIVVYVNGVNKPDEQQVAIDANMLHMELLRSNVYQGSVKYFYNPSESLWLDLVTEAIPQKAGDTLAEFASAFLTFGMNLAGLKLPFDAAEAELLDRLNAAVMVKINGFLQTAEGVALLDQWSPTLQTTVDSSNKVVVVAHSQGNFIANAMHARVRDASPDWIAKGLSIVNIANPTAQAPSGLYLTSSSDLVMAGVPLRLPINLFVDPVYAMTIDGTGHGFVQTYLSDALQSISDGKSVLEKTLGLISAALKLGGDIPRCCAGLPEVSPYRRPLTPPLSSLYYSLTASDSGDAIFDKKEGIKFGFGGGSAFASEPWELGALVLDPKGDLSVVIRVPDAFEFKPKAYLDQKANSWIQFPEPRDIGRMGEVLLQFNYLIDRYDVEMKSVAPVCMEYNHNNVAGTFDRTDSPYALVWVEVAGSFLWQRTTRQRADCLSAGPTCLMEYQPTFDNARVSFDFGPTVGPIRVDPKAVQF